MSRVGDRGIGVSGLFGKVETVWFNDEPKVFQNMILAQHNNFAALVRKQSMSTPLQGNDP